MRSEPRQSPDAILRNKFRMFLCENHYYITNNSSRSSDRQSRPWMCSVHYSSDFETIRQTYFEVKSPFIDFQCKQKYETLQFSHRINAKISIVYFEGQGLTLFLANKDSKIFANCLRKLGPWILWGDIWRKTIFVYFCKRIDVDRRYNPSSL